MPSRTVSLVVLTFVVAFLVAPTALAGDPGDPLPGDLGTIATSDQRPGSLMIFNIYTSSTTNPSSQNTSISITNTSETQFATVHLFFVDGTTCSVADRFLCLTRQQTATFFAYDQDPGVTGYLIAIAVDSITGIPIRFNFLIGIEYVKFSTGHADALGAESYVRFSDQINPSLPGTVGLLLDGFVYSQAALVLAIDNIPSPRSGNRSMLILNRVGGNLTESALSLRPVFGILYDEGEQAHSFTIVGGCQIREILSDTFPRTTPRFSAVIPQGTVGWVKLMSLSGAGMSGAILNANAALASRRVQWRTQST